MRNNILLFILLLVGACGSGLSIYVYRGNHHTERLERKVKDPKTGRTGTQFIRPDSTVFSEMQCLHDSEMWKVQELYNRAKKAGVKMDDL